MEAERQILNRDNKQLTSRTGYAGGSKTDKEGRVCYHNFQRIADYGGLGHGEVVGMSLPSDKVSDFAQVYFSLFNPKTKGTMNEMKFYFLFSIICFVFLILTSLFVFPRSRGPTG